MHRLQGSSVHAYMQVPFPHARFSSWYDVAGHCFNCDCECVRVCVCVHVCVCKCLCVCVIIAVCSCTCRNLVLAFTFSLSLYGNLFLTSVLTMSKIRPEH